MLSDTANVAGSQGVRPSTFTGIKAGDPVDEATLPGAPDPIFSLDGIDVRRTTGRNTPSVINAVFNFRNFWDGRAQNEFNGVDPFGTRNPAARVGQVDPATGTVAKVPREDHERLARLAGGRPARQRHGDVAPPAATCRTSAASSCRCARCARRS